MPRTAVPIRTVITVTSMGHIVVLANVLGPNTIKDDDKKNELLALLRRDRYKARHFSGIGQAGAYCEGSLYPGTNQPSCSL